MICVLRSKKKKEEERVKLLNDIKAYESTLSYLNNELDAIEDEVKDDCERGKVKSVLLRSLSSVKSRIRIYKDKLGSLEDRR